MTLFKPLHSSVDANKRMFSWVSSIPPHVFQWSQAVAGGGNSAGDMLFGLVILFSGEKDELLRQKPWCAPKAKGLICKT